MAFTNNPPTMDPMQDNNMKKKMLELQARKQGGGIATPPIVDPSQLPGQASDTKPSIGPAMPGPQQQTPKPEMDESPEVMAARQSFLSKWKGGHQRPMAPPTPSMTPPQPQIPSMQWAQTDKPQHIPQMQGTISPMPAIWRTRGVVGPMGRWQQMGGGQAPPSAPPSVGANRAPLSPGMEYGPRGGQRPIRGGGLQSSPMPQMDLASMYNNYGGMPPELYGGVGMQQDPRMMYYNMMSGNV